MNIKYTYIVRIERKLFLYQKCFKKYNIYNYCCDVLVVFLSKKLAYPSDFDGSLIYIYDR